MSRAPVSSPKRSGRPFGAAAALFGLLLALAWAGPAGALIVTPGISAGVGYDDNVRLQSPARSDFFATISPSLRLEAGDPAHRFTAEGGVDYAYYHRLSQYTKLDTARASLRYHKEFSGATKLDIYNHYVSTYDPAEVSETGQLVRVRPTDSLRTTNTTGVGFWHYTDPISHFGGDYQFAYATGTGEGDEEARMQRAMLRWLQAWTPSHHLQLDATGRYDIWETSPDIQEVGGSATWFWLWDQRRTFSLAGGGSMVRAKGDDQQLQQARDYDVYWATAGFSHRYSPAFDWSASLGWSYVSGDGASNAAAGSGYPTAQLSATYRQERWSLEAYGKATLDEYDAVGENSGLTKTQAVGARWLRDLARHWRLTLYADYIRDDYQQDPARASTSINRGVVDTTRLGALLSWEILRDLTMYLDYRHLDRNAENDEDDRRQNRVFLHMDYRYPVLW